MGFQVGGKITKEDCYPFKIYYEGQKRVMPEPEADPDSPVLNSMGESAAFMTWYLKPMLGRLQKVIADEMVDMNQRKGKAKMLTGSATMKKVVQCTFEVEGLDFRGVERKHMSNEVFDEIPGWVINAVGEKIDDLNGNVEADDKDGGTEG